MSIPASAIQAKNLSCGYRDRPVLNDLNFEVGPGECVALLGPNGSGKSTLLQTLSGLLKPLSGEIRIQGEDLSRLPVVSVSQKVATVPQEESPLFGFSVRQVVLMGRLAHSQGLMDTPEDFRVAESALNETDCLHLADRIISELSGGERQRVLIARALAQVCPVMLLDEPTSHLDPGHQLSVANLVRKLANKGISIAVAVHDLNFATRIASRAILLSNGRIALDGPIHEVLASPKLDEVYGVHFERLQTSNGDYQLSPFAAFLSPE